MFRSFVYLDEEKLYSYLKQIDKDFVNRPMELNTKRAKGGSIGLSSLNLTAGTETEEKRSYEKDVFNDYDRFEKDLEKLEASEYFDFVLNSGYDLKSLPKMCIIRFDGRFEIRDLFVSINNLLNIAIDRFCKHIFDVIRAIQFHRDFCQRNERDFSRGFESFDGTEAYTAPFAQFFLRYTASFPDFFCAFRQGEVNLICCFPYVFVHLHHLISFSYIIDNILSFFNIFI